MARLVNRGRVIAHFSTIEAATTTSGWSACAAAPTPGTGRNMQPQPNGMSVDRFLPATTDASMDPAWPWDWENRPAKDGCDHQWEVVVVERLFNPTEMVARCGTCHT